LPQVETPPPPPVAEPPQPQGPVRVSPGQGPGLIKRVEPEYPRILQSARLQGSVVLDAIIRTDGSVAEVRVLETTHPLFAQSAVEAIRQWRYSPPPTDVILTVRVNFTIK
jgi:TonB family protein